MVGVSVGSYGAEDSHSQREKRLDKSHQTVSRFWLLECRSFVVFGAIWPHCHYYVIAISALSRSLYSESGASCSVRSTVLVHRIYSLHLDKSNILSWTWFVWRVV
jgi:hypothetical protein